MRKSDLHLRHLLGHAQLLAVCPDDKQLKHLSKSKTDCHFIWLASSLNLSQSPS